MIHIAEHVDELHNLLKLRHLNAHKSKQPVDTLTPKEDDRLEEFL
jgi:hypothetical protein